MLDLQKFPDSHCNILAGNSSLTQVNSFKFGNVNTDCKLAVSVKVSGSRRAGAEAAEVSIYLLRSCICPLYLSLRAPSVPYASLTNLITVLQGIK